MPLNKVFLEARFLLYLSFVNFSPNCSFHFPFFNLEFHSWFVFCLFSIFGPLWLCTLIIYLSLIMIVNATDLFYVYNTLICIHIYTHNTSRILSSLPIKSQHLHWPSECCYTPFPGFWRLFSEINFCCCFFFFVVSRLIFHHYSLLELSKFDRYLFGFSLFLVSLLGVSFSALSRLGINGCAMFTAFLLWPFLWVW